MTASQEKVQALKNNLIQLVQTKQFKKAEKLYSKHKNDSISDTDIWNIFAGINSERKKFKEVISCCDKIIKLSPENFQAHYNCGVAHQYLNNFKKAVARFESCIKIKPEHSAAYANCAYLYQQAGNLDKAVDYYQKSLSYAENPEVRVQLGKTQAGSGNTAGAIENYKRALIASPNNIKMLFLLAQQYYEDGDYSNAEKHYLKLLETNKHDARVLNNLGRLYAETGRIEKAIECYNHAIKTDCSQAIIFENLGKAYLKAGETEKSEQAFLKSMELNPDSPETCYNLGMIYSQIGNIEKARQFLVKVTEMEIPKGFEKPDEFLMAVKYHLSYLDQPEQFDENHKIFVANLFDDFAQKFENTLVDNLNYQAPKIIAKYAKSRLEPNSKYKHLLDLGCGTGLCGKHMSPFVSHLTGIDISTKMVEKTRSLNIYDKVIHGEIVEEANKLHDQYDIIVAADVFIYIGGINNVFSACSRICNQDGLFIFSIESLPVNESVDYKLYDTGRYKHSINYLDSIAKKHKFKIIENIPCALRKEHHKDVEGAIIALQKT